ncbi:MAG: peptide chain release factor N(5)-glutamine methyltransferase [Candidatus Krumholzibacteriia bacterium]
MPEALKSVRDLILAAAGWLDGKGVSSARLNAERLLGHVLGLSRLELYLHHDRPLTSGELERFRELLRRRGAGEPLQTLIGEQEFYSRPFRVEPGVFIPRPETETLVERCVALLTAGTSRLAAPVALDLCCGTGVVGLSLAAEIPALSVWATDINPAAVRLTEANAHRLGVAPRVVCLAGNLADPLPARLAGQVDLLVSNPPYVRRDEIDSLPVEVSHDPREALDGGPDGLGFYRALGALGRRWLRPGGWLAVEIGADQAADVSGILERGGWTGLVLTRDLAGRPRVVTALRAPEESRPPAGGDTPVPGG